jgi:hypothetical protein
MNKIALSYVAGFFDGEGSINLIKNSKRKRSKDSWCAEYNLTIAIGQKDGSILDWIKDNLGGNISLVKRDGSYFWYCGGRKAEAILKKILPFLKCKKPQAKLALTFYNRKDGKKFMPVSQKEIIRRESIRQGIIALHKSIIKSRYTGSTTKRADLKGM